MRVLVLGGTGAMGVHLVHKLVQNGFETFVTSRIKRKSEGDLKYLHGNAKNMDFLENILRDHWDTIVDFMNYTTDEFKIRCTLLLNSTSHYIHLSTARVYADDNQPITENTKRLLDTIDDEYYLKTDEYALAKARQEDILQSSTNNNWTIVRPYITYSEYRLQLGVLEKENWLYRAMQGRTIVFSSDIVTKATTMTYGLNVAEGIFSLIGNIKAHSNIYHITIENAYTWAEILEIYLDEFEKVLGFKPKVLLQDLDNFFKTHPHKYQIKYDRLYNRVFDNSKFRSIVDEIHFTKIDEGLRNCLREFLKNPKFKQINWKREALKDKLTKEQTPLKEITGWRQKVKYLVFRYLPAKFVSFILKVLS
jgi:nucleoside-diphosphate-sugar epimerase